MIEITGLSKSYGTNRVLDNICMSFNAGSVYGIVGENGAGKTTLFRCMAGLERYEGSIDTGTMRLRDHLGFLQTEPWFLQKITGREYIRLLCNARGKPADGIDAKNIFDLPLDRYASTYSTGMKKKLALLSILMQDNRVFILDEPFNGVDIQSNIVITGIIRKLKTLGHTVIISSHIFSTLADTCDAICLLKDKIIARKVTREGFSSLEEELGGATAGDRIDRLGLGKR